jgi:hypothetical protein
MIDFFSQHRLKQNGEVGPPVQGYVGVAFCGGRRIESEELIRGVNGEKMHHHMRMSIKPSNFITCIKKMNLTFYRHLTNVCLFSLL